MLTDLLQFGLGATLIGIFFIPFVLKLYADNKQLNKDLAAEKDKRFEDMKESRDVVLKPVETFNTVTQAILAVKTKAGHE